MLINLVNQDQLRNRYSEVNWGEKQLSSANWEDGGSDGVQTGFIEATGVREVSVLESGYYLVAGFVRYSHNANGFRHLGLLFNNALKEETIIYTDDMPVSTNTDLTFCTLLYVTESDRLRLQIYQNSGVSLTVKLRLKLFRL